MTAFVHENACAFVSIVHDMSRICRDVVGWFFRWFGFLREALRFANGIIAIKPFVENHFHDLVFGLSGGFRLQLLRTFNQLERFVRNVDGKTVPTFRDWLLARALSFVRINLRAFAVDVFESCFFCECEKLF